MLAVFTGISFAPEESDEHVLNGNKFEDKDNFDY